VQVSRITHNPGKEKGGCAMKAISKILFPVDLSEVSSKLAPDAIAFAQKFNAELHLLLVAGSFEKWKTFYVPHPSLTTFGAEVLKGGQQKLKEFVEEFFAEFPKLKTAVVQGDPAEVILKYIASEKVDLVIMGTHGRKGLDRILFGSVANEVVKNSPAPVLTINPYRKL
jgi:nucleotide-binding universal stress UspA family protein